jgi:hypothetical protein
MPLSQLVESYNFWDVVTLWAKEQLDNEGIVARALASAVICDGLALNSVDKRWLKGDREKIELRGYPYMGYCPVQGGEMMVLRVEALEHLLAIVRRAETPSRDVLAQEFVLQKDFAKWLGDSNHPLPSFWFAESSVAG